MSRHFVPLMQVILIASEWKSLKTEQYTLIMTPMTRAEANLSCLSNGRNLPGFETALENRVMEEEIRGAGLKHVWTSLDKKTFSDWLSVDGRRIIRSKFNRVVELPKETGDRKDCIVWTSSGLKSVDCFTPSVGALCRLRECAVCDSWECSRLENGCVRRICGTKHWYHAADVCASLSGVLEPDPGLQLTDKLKSMYLSPCEEYWVGIRESIWIDPNGGPNHFNSIWATVDQIKSPNGACAVLRIGKIKSWLPVSCTEKYPAICVLHDVTTIKDVVSSRETGSETGRAFSLTTQGNNGNSSVIADNKNGEDWTGEERQVNSSSCERQHGTPAKDDTRIFLIIVLGVVVLLLLVSISFNFRQMHILRMRTGNRYVRTYQTVASTGGFVSPDLPLRPTEILPYAAGRGSCHQYDNVDTAQDKGYSSTSRDMGTSPKNTSLGQSEVQNGSVDDLTPQSCSTSVAQQVYDKAESILYGEDHTGLGKEGVNLPGPFQPAHAHFSRVQAPCKNKAEGQLPPAPKPCLLKLPSSSSSMVGLHVEPKGCDDRVFCTLPDRLPIQNLGVSDYLNPI